MTKGQRKKREGRPNFRNSKKLATTKMSWESSGKMHALKKRLLASGPIKN